MIIKNNLNALNACRNKKNNTNNIGKSMKKMASGLRVSEASDDSASLAISEKMRGQIRGLNQASRNAQDGISLIQTAEGALSETTEIIQKMRKLAVQASSDTNTQEDRDAIQIEIDKLIEEIDSIANNTKFNSRKLLDGSIGTINNGVQIIPEQKGQFEIKLSAGLAAGDTFTIEGTTVTFGSAEVASRPAAILFLRPYFPDYDIDVSHNLDSITLTQKVAADKKDITVTSGATNTAIGTAVTIREGSTAKQIQINGGGLNLQVGANAEEIINVSIDDMRANALRINPLNVTTHNDANNAITALDDAITKVSTEKSNLGSYQNRLEHTMKNVDNTSENLQSSESKLRDANMAKEQLNISKDSILDDVSQAMFVQANQQPQRVLELLK